MAQLCERAAKISGTTRVRGAREREREREKRKKQSEVRVRSTREKKRE